VENTWVIRATGALLALSTVANGIWFAASGNDELVHVRLGVAGALAVGLLWAARARSARRSTVRSVLVSAVLLVGCAAALLAFVDIAGHHTPFSSLFDSLAPADEGVPEEFELTPDLAIDPLTALSWALTLGSVFVAAGAGALARRRAGVVEGRADDHWLLVPFAGLVIGALVGMAFVSAAIAGLSALWLERALAASSPPETFRMSTGRL